MSYLLDYHIHTNVSGTNHAIGSLWDYANHAVDIGLSEIGFSEHIFNSQMEAGMHCVSNLLNEYVINVEKTRSQFPQLLIKLGLEIDYLPSKSEFINSIINSYQVDYVIGSVHYLDSWMFDNPDEIEEYSRRDINQCYIEYFEQTQKLASAGLFDIVGHLDLLKKFGYKPTKRLDSLFEKTIKIIAENQLVVEVNTAGLREPVKEIYPSEQLLRLCFENNIAVTLGSDAHEPEEVGYAINEALESIKKVGYKKVIAFTRRRRNEINI